MPSQNGQAQQQGNNLPTTGFPVTRNTNSSYYVESISTDNAPQCLLEDSFINNTMTYSSDSVIRDCNVPVAMCLLHFTKQCEGRICYGPYCSYHHQLTSMRQFIGLTNEDKLTSRIVSVSQTQMHGRFMHIITSIIPLGENISYFEQWTKDLTNIPHDERNVIAKFYTLLCNPESACDSNSEQALLRQYVNEVTAYFYNLIRAYQNQLINIKMPICMSEEQESNLIKRSKWFQINHKADGVKKVVHNPMEGFTTKKLMTYYIPIMKFNAFDILNFMTYNLEPSLNQEGYLNNCELVHTHIVHGTNYGIHNNVDTYSITNQNFNYPTQLNAIINSEIVSRITNLDVLNLYCSVENEKVCRYVELPAATLKTDACAKFNITAITAPILFKYR